MRYGFIGTAIALALLAGCVADTKNVGGGFTWPHPPPLNATFAADNLREGYLDGWHEGLTATLTVSWSGGTKPYTISADMGGGTTEDIPAGTQAVSPFVQVFTLVEGGPFTYTVTVTDANANSGFANGTYTVGPPPKHPPSIDNLAYGNGVLTVDVSDPDGDDLTVTVTEPDGLRADATSKEAIGSTVTFVWRAENIVTGGSGTSEVTVDDGRGGSDTEEVSIIFHGLMPPEDTLVALPLAVFTTTDDVLTIVVLSGPSTHPFHYMNGVGVTVDAGATYVDTTFNVGLPGGAQMDPDGVWTDVAPDSFLLPPDFMIQENDIGGGRVRIDFNVTPIGGHETTDGGALFNFGLNFTTAGIYTLGFEEFHDVKRTYYSDSGSTEYNWDDISNDLPAMPNTIEVV